MHDGPPPAPVGQVWQSVPALSDEFAGPLDIAKWSTAHPYWTGRPPSQYVAANVTVAGGHARLAASALPGGIGAAVLASAKPIAGPGYYEARVQSSRIVLSSSFWLQNRSAEIDVQEAVGAPKAPAREYEMRSHLHYFPQGWQSDQATAQMHMMRRPVFRWHTYGVWWRDARSVWFYLDGRKVGELAFPQDVTTPMYLFFDTEAFETEGLPTATDLTNRARNTMTIDWVRSYALKPRS